MSGYRVFPIRFSADTASMVRFLEVLGLRSVLESVDGGYVHLEGAAGSLAVHPTDSAASDVGHGWTSLNLLAADVGAAAAELRQAGREATTWDEAYGLQGAVLAPDGHAIGLNEARPADLYGYRVHAGESMPIDVVAVWYSDDFARDTAFFADLGLRPQGGLDDPWWRALTGQADSGTVGLHAPTGPSAPTHADPGTAGLDAPALVRLGFETAEPLDDLVARLEAAGYVATLTADEAGPKVVLVDPDGQPLEIHPRPDR